MHAWQRLKKTCETSSGGDNANQLGKRHSIDGCTITCAQALNWGEVRRKETLEALLKEELAMVDDQAPDGHRLFWFPCLADFAGTSAATASAA